MIGFVAFWFLIYVLKDRLQKCNVLVMNAFYIGFETTAFNLSFINLYKRLPPIIKQGLAIWYSLGSIVVICGHVVLPCYAFYWIIVQSLASHSVVDLESSFSSPMIPGLGLSIDGIIYIWLCTVMVLVIHEVGHALAAAVAHIEISGIGVFFALLYPGAYVNIDDSTQHLPLLTQLCIYSAGIWHNICSILILQVMFNNYPQVLTSTTHEVVPIGTSVTHIDYPYRSFLSNILQSTTWDVLSRIEVGDNSGSVFAGVLQPGDIISRINDIPIHNREELFRYLTHLRSNIRNYMGAHPQQGVLLSHHLGVPFTLSRSVLNSIQLNSNNAHALQTCCAHYFKHDPYPPKDDAGECFVEWRESLEKKLSHMEHHHPPIESVESVTTAKTYLRQRQRISTSQKQGMENTVSAHHPHPTYNYFCVGVRDIYHHSLLRWVDIRTHGSMETRDMGLSELGWNETVTLQPVADTHLFTLMIDIYTKSAPVHSTDHTPTAWVQSIPYYSQTVVVETSPDHIFEHTSFSDYIPKRMFSESAPVSYLQFLYHTCIYTPLVWLPEVYHRLIWTSLQVYVKSCMIL